MKHMHHIIPRHAGGTDDSSNLISLTIEEHAEAHRLLYEQHGRWQDKAAWMGLLKMVPKEQLIAFRLSHAGKAGNTKRGLNTGMKYDMSKIVKEGKRKGANNPGSRNYLITLADGSELLVRSLKTWCEEQGIKYNSFHTKCILRNGVWDGITARRA